MVRGAINAAWDKLGSSGGALGVPVADETYNGELATQAFSGGQVSWNRLTKAFTTVPPDLAKQLADLQVPIDPTAAINMAWRAAGGPSGPLGAKQGDQYPVGGDGLAQNFAGGKIFFSPATGANAVESDILAKYESLGGPGGNLGFPIANEADGGLQAGQPGKRVRRRRQTGDLLDARPRRVCGPRRDQGRVGQTRRRDRQTGRAGGRAERAITMWSRRGSSLVRSRGIRRRTRSATQPAEPGVGSCPGCRCRARRCRPVRRRPTAGPAC